MAILAVNAGSSTLKFSLHLRRGTEADSGMLAGNAQGLGGTGEPAMDWTWRGERRSRSLAGVAGGGHAAALVALRELMAAEASLPPLEAVAHRVVHGGATFRASVRVDAGVLAQLEALNSLAPLHQPHNLAGIRAFQAAFPEVPQIACFDTAFHATLPLEETTFAIPRELSAAGIRRYGFHGLSYQYIIGALQDATPRAAGRVLMAHLGNGASLCAALDGASRATTMGFSALDGLMMGTRSGAIDAGVLLHLLEQGWDHDRLEAMLYRKSGLLGVSGVSADMRRLRADVGAAAAEAIALFTHRVVREAGAMTAVLGGLDVLAFSGGIGEHDAVLREAVCACLGYLGVAVDGDANRAAVGDAMRSIHAPGSAVEVWVVPTDEGRVAAREAARLLGARG